MILVIGAKGGVGTSTVAAEMARTADAIGLDLTDGRLAGLLERPTWLLEQLVFATATSQRERIDDVIRRRVSLLWTPECALSVEKAWSAIRDIHNRCPVIADGGLEPPGGAAEAADVVVIVSADNAIARWHTRRLQARFSGAIAIEQGTKEVARDLADRLFGCGD